MITRITAHDPALQPLADKFGRILGKLCVGYVFDNLFVAEPPTVEEWWSRKLAAGDVNYGAPVPRSAESLHRMFNEIARKGKRD